VINSGLNHCLLVISSFVSSWGGSSS